MKKSTLWIYYLANVPLFYLNILKIKMVHASFHFVYEEIVKKGKQTKLNVYFSFLIKLKYFLHLIS